MTHMGAHGAFVCHRLVGMLRAHSGFDTLLPPFVTSRDMPASFFKVCMTPEFMVRPAARFAPNLYDSRASR